LERIDLDRAKVRVAIAEDHLGVRKGLLRLLEQNPQIVVVGEARNGQEALEIVEQTEPDVLILDIMMPDMDGIAVIENLQEAGDEVLIVVLSAIDDPLFVREILNLGACHFILKGDVLELFAAIQQAYQGECQNDEDRFSLNRRVRVYIDHSADITT